MVVVVLYMFLCSVLLSGCRKENPQNQGTKKEEAVKLSDSFIIQEENNIDYQTGMECSGFASAYILRHFGESADGKKVYDEIPNKMPDGGVVPDSIVDFFTELGYEAEFKESGTIKELKQEIMTGNPVILFIHMKEPYESVHETHYVPMTGYDKQYIYVAESVKDAANCIEKEKEGYNRKIEVSQFERLWSNVDGVWENPYFVIRKNITS